MSRLVNRALAEYLGRHPVEDVDVSVVELKMRRDELLEEERELLQLGRVLLRSGAYLPEYAQKLFGGRNSRNVDHHRRGRLPLPALAGKKEQNVLRRILARREQIIQELVDIEDRLLPEEQFPVGLGERGWTVRQPPSRRKKTGRSSNQDAGGEK